MADPAPLTLSERKFRAKRYNEGLKLAATLFNSLSIVIFGTAFVGPITQGHFEVLSGSGWALLLPALSLHLVAQAVMRLLRPEE